MQFTTHQDPVQVILSDSKSFIRATIALKAVQCFEEQWHHRITKGTTGGLIQLLDFEVVATHLGDPRLQLTLLINELGYLGCSQSATYGHPQSIETREGIQDFLSELRKFRRQEEVAVPLSGNRMESSQADQGEDMSSSDEHEGERDDRSKQIYMTQLPTHKPSKRTHRGLDSAACGSQRLAHAQKAEDHPDVTSSCQRDKAQKGAKGAKRWDTPAVSKQALPAASGQRNIKGNITNRPIELLGLLKNRYSSEPQVPACPRTLSPKQLSPERSRHAIVRNRYSPDQDTEQVEDTSSPNKKIGSGLVNVDNPTIPLPKSQEHMTTCSQSHIDNAQTESLGNRGTTSPKHDDPWRGMSRIRRKDVTIPASQQILLDCEDCWLPPGPGKRGPVANMPVPIIESLSAEVDQQLAQPDETALPPQLFGDNNDEAESLGLPGHGKKQDDRDSEGDSAISSSDWPPSSPRTISRHNQLPPNSSAEYLPREIIRDDSAITARVPLSNAHSSSRSTGKKIIWEDADLDGKHVVGCSRPQSLTGKGLSQADPSYVSSFPNPSGENEDLMADCGPSDLAGTRSNESDGGESDPTSDRLGAATKLQECDLAEHAASLNQADEGVLEHDKKAAAARHNGSMFDHVDDTSLRVLNTFDQASSSAVNATVGDSNPKLLGNPVKPLQNHPGVTKAGKTVIDLDSGSSSSSESELEPVAPNALPVNLEIKTCSEGAKATPIKAHDSALQVDRTPCLPDVLPANPFTSVEVLDRLPSNKSNLHSNVREARIFGQDEIIDDVVIPATFDMALSRENGRLAEGDSAKGLPRLPKRKFSGADHDTNDLADSRYIIQTDRAHHVMTNRKRNLVENEELQLHASSQKKRLRIAEVTFAESENERLSVAQQVRQYRREVFAAADLRRQTREEPEAQSDTGDSQFDQKYHGVKAPSEEICNKMVLSSPTCEKPPTRSERVRLDSGPCLGESKDAIPEVIHTIQQQSPQALRSPPLSDYETTLSARPTQVTVYARFKEAYPEYKSNEKHFVAMCKKIEILENEDRMEHRSLWDDFIIQHEGAYRQYLLDCAEQVQDPLPYEAYYRKEIDDPRFMRRIMTPSNLRDVLSVENLDAQKDSKPSETPKHEKGASQKATRNCPIEPSPIKIGVDLKTERPGTRPAPQPLLSSSSKPEENNRQPIPWLVDGEYVPSRKNFRNHSSSSAVPSTVPATTGPSKFSDMPPSSTQPLPPLPIHRTHSPLGCTKNSWDNLKPQSTSSRYNSEASPGPLRRENLSSPNLASSSLVRSTNLTIPEDRCDRAGNTIIPAQAPKLIPPTSVSYEWWRDPASPFKTFARADAAIRGGNGNAFADKKVKQVRVEWPMVENGIVKAHIKSLNVLDWKL